MNRPDILSQALQQQSPLILDGGLATELELAGHDLAHPLWSAKLLGQSPLEIALQHRAFLEAGADIISTSGYQATFPGLIAEGHSPHEAAGLMRLAVDLACEVRDQFDDNSSSPARIRPLVAASIGPYGAYLTDGSEYRGNYGLERAELYDFHAARFELLAESLADLLACETVPAFDEAEVLADLANQTDTPRTWISFSCKDGLHLSDGTPFAECAALIQNSHGIVALGINCTAPENVGSLIAEARKAGLSKPIIAYPNSGEKYDPIQKKWRGNADTEPFVDAAKKWVALGANVIGGCCRVSPEHIRKLRSAFVKHT
jgi:homocysteine S-methyltransferase